MSMASIGDKDLLRQLGGRIRDRRTALKLSQLQFGEKC